uniref:Uncharacterized protein n=2 Tax=Cacopsylla melanoneura TaxID=428564 RepID=A0A8D9FEJ5_9HEMI
MGKKQGSQFIACSTNEGKKGRGYKWCPTNDCFSYSISEEYVSPTTKRQALSKIASIYDVNGFLSPVTIYLKIFMQQVWLNKGVSWDSPLPINLQKQWDKIMSEMHLLREVQVPRYILGSNPETLDLVGFADASGAAYAAVVYLRVPVNISEETVYDHFSQLFSMSEPHSMNMDMDSVRTLHHSLHPILDVPISESELDLVLPNLLTILVHNIILYFLTENTTLSPKGLLNYQLFN